MKASDTRLTPDWLLERMTRFLGDWLDPCPALGRKGLAQEWPRTRPVYCNPPGSLKNEFAGRFAYWARAGMPGAYMLFDWDHGTKHWRTVYGFADCFVLFTKRMKMRGPAWHGQPESDWALWDVGRSQALATVNVGADEVRRVFDDCATVIEL